MIQKISLQKAMEIYPFMKEDFPENEIPDYKNFLNLIQKNIHQVYVYKENEQEMAYFVTLEKDKKVLITYLAVIKKYRGKGVGKRFIQEIKEYLSDKEVIIVEVESEKNAKNEQELTIIQKRLRYYFNADFQKCEGIEYKLFNIDYYILTYSNTNTKISNEELKQVIENIYEGLFYKKHLNIHLTK